jgi:cysteine-rich repeat protein
LLALVIAAVPWLAATLALAQSDRFEDYVVIANQELKFGRENSVASGNVAVETSGAAGGKLYVNKKFVGSDGAHLVADAAQISGPSNLFALFANTTTVVGRHEVVIRAACGDGPCTFPAPVLGELPSVSAMTAGTTDVTIPPRTTVTLAAGNYGRVRLRGRSALVLTGGSYNFRELRADRLTRVLFTAPTALNIEGNLLLGGYGLVGPVGPGARAQDLMIAVHGTKVRLRHHITFAGKLWAPNALMVVGTASLVKGQLFADRVRMGRGVVLQAALPIGPFALRTNTPTNTFPPTDTPTITPTFTETPIPTSTNTSPPTAIPTETPIPDTATATPTETEVPPPATNTPLIPTATETAPPPIDTPTAPPGATDTSTPEATDTATPSPTETATPENTSTLVPSPTQTSIPTSTAVATATGTSPPPPSTATATGTPARPVHPILECVIDNGNGTYTAHFGYLNENAAAVSIPLGAANKFSPGAQDRGQPTTFQPGRTPYWPQAAFNVVFDGSNLTWTLTGPDGGTRTATASSGSTPCAEHVFLDKKWYDLAGQPMAGPPANLPPNYTLTATSSHGTATCSYSGSTLECTYENDPGLDGNGLWVPVGSTYSVSEANLPSDFGPLSGTGNFLSKVPGGTCANPYAGVDKYCLHVVRNMESGSCDGPVSLESTNFEQVNYITQVLGGTVNQIGGAAPGQSMNAASDFQGGTSTQTGVSVGVPTYIFASTVIAADLTGNTEPGNISGVILGPPSDLTYTTPGNGGPDGTEGDGSLVLAKSGNFVTVGFGTALSTSSCEPRSLILFTDTAGGGTAMIELLWNGSPVASTVAAVPGGGVATAIGGVAFAIDNVVFEHVRITRLSGDVEVDAVAVRGSLSLPGGAAICGDGVREGGEECDDGNVLSGDGCSSDCRNEYLLLVGTRHCSLSQGGWGGPNGSDFSTRAPDILPVTIGGPERSTALHTQAAVSAYLPKGGPASALSNGERDFYAAEDIFPDGGGVLAGQTTALSLAINLSNSDEVFANLGALVLPIDPFCTQPLNPGDDGLIGTEDDVLDASAEISGPWTIPGSIATAGNTVGEVLLMANQYLRGSTSAASISDVNSAADTINNAFKECQQVVPCP